MLPSEVHRAAREFLREIENLITRAIATGTVAPNGRGIHRPGGVGGSPHNPASTICLTSSCRMHYADTVGSSPTLRAFNAADSYEHPGRELLMGIPPAAPISLDLAQATPSVLDADALCEQIKNLGLDCAQITPENLAQYISEVESQLADGAIQSFMITAPAGTVAANTLPAGLNAVEEPSLHLMSAAPAAEPPVGSLAAAMPANQAVATGNWTENDAAQGWAPNLAVIQYSDHFTWLMTQAASIGFPGIVDNPPAYTGNYQNAQAIQTLFVNVGVTSSATVVKGIDTDTMKAVFTNAIQPLADANLTNYDQSGSRSIMLVENYNQTTRTCDAIGVVSVDWRLQISDWKRKTKEGGETHPTVLTIGARSALYSDVSLLCQHYAAVLTQFGIDPSTAPKCRTV